MKSDTIYALSSGGLPSGIAVLRLSGPGARTALRRLGCDVLPAPRTAFLHTLIHPSSGQQLDRALVIWFPAPRSFTGEDLVELHVHGGRAVVAAVIEAFSFCPGLRPAEAGEFSRRAFENGKLDLTEVEGLADMIAAETETQRRQALRQMLGELGGLYESWRVRLLRAMAQLEASIDFSDEDLPDDLSITTRQEVAAVRKEIQHHLFQGRGGEILRNGLHVAIIGPPNVGKSSLLNLMARREAAIVSEWAGTTRDVIEVHLDLGGWPLVVADTAGLRLSDNQVEMEGVRRARTRAQEADLVVAVFDAASWPEVDADISRLLGSNALIVINKVDLDPVREGSLGGFPLFPLSIKTGQGWDQFIDALRREVERRCQGGDAALWTRERHRRGLVDCVEAMDRYFQVADNRGGVEMEAEELRMAAASLGRITGRMGVEDLLDVIFREFCIGK